jgi:hypothetical protein
MQNYEARSAHSKPPCLLLFYGFIPSTAAADEPLYTDADLKKCVDRIEVIDYHMVSRVWAPVISLKLKSLSVRM